MLPQVSDAAQDAFKGTQEAADSLRKDMETPGPAAPYAGTPLTSLPPTPPGSDIPVSLTMPLCIPCSPLVP